MTVQAGGKVQLLRYWYPHLLQWPFNEPWNEFAHMRVGNWRTNYVDKSRRCKIWVSKEKEKNGLHTSVWRRVYRAYTRERYRNRAFLTWWKSIIEMIGALDNVTQGWMNAVCYGVSLKILIACSQVEGLNVKYNPRWSWQGGWINRGLAQAGANGIIICTVILGQ